MNLRLIIALLLIAGCVPQEQMPNSQLLLEEGQYEIVSSDVNYYGNSKGFFAEPKFKGNYPGIIMIHEWWGLNDNIKEMAKLLASQGYVVLAVDMYEGKVAKNQTEARQFTSSLNQTKAIENMKAAKEYLKSKNAQKIASLGWCFGGGQSLQLALNDELDATVIYYGRLTDDKTQLSNIRWPVLGIFGAEDTGIPVASVNAFDAALDSLNVENEIYIYPGVGHAFANPSGMNYAAEETKDAWDKTLAFLEKSLK